MYGQHGFAAHHGHRDVMTRKAEQTASTEPG